MSFGRTLFTTYNGYAQFVPRLLAQIARGAPPARAAEVFALAGAISFALTAGLVFHMSKGHIAAPLVRVLLVAAMVLLPIATSELLDNILNVPWWLFFAAFWALLWRPQTAPGQAVAGAVCFLASASEPLVALFIPLAVVRTFAFRARREHAATAGLVLGLLYQGVARLVGGTKPFPPASLHGIGQDYAERAGLALLGGMRGSDWLISQNPTVAVAVGALIVCVVVVAGLSVERPLVTTHRAHQQRPRLVGELLRALRARRQHVVEHQATCACVSPASSFTVVAIAVPLPQKLARFDVQPRAFCLGLGR